MSAPISDMVEPFLDLVDAPYTLPGSRLLVQRATDGLAVRTAEYERDATRSAVIHHLQVVDHADRPLPVSRVTADRIECGPVSLTFAGPEALSIGSVGGTGWSVRFRTSGAVEDGQWAPGLPSAGYARVVGTVDQLGPTEIRVRPQSSAGLTLTVGSLQALTSAQPDHARWLTQTARTWTAWMSRCPEVEPELAPMAAYCWWVLGANQVNLHGHGDTRVVVPSKLGYVGLWQWDAYFIASGLRHGAPELARDQLDLAFRHAARDGQLPDVVHDGGVLASSEDLPATDVEKLWRDGSGVRHQQEHVPLTKPPLAAWAVRRVAATLGDPGWQRQAMAIVARSQDWWFDYSDTDSDGMPEYGHPYSSGLDDSPIFDHASPVVSPDLAAYLILQDELLVTWAESSGDPDAAKRHRERSASTLQHLMKLWDSERGVFYAQAGGRRLQDCTVVGLLPLLTGRLPGSTASALRASLSDPMMFDAPWGVPTVARSDPAFAPEHMWRGPTWINTNALLVEGLDRSGFHDAADELAARSLELVIHGAGPHEYFNPLTGARAAGATTAFGWSAALFIDLAVARARGRRYGG